MVPWLAQPRTVYVYREYNATQLTWQLIDRGLRLISGSATPREPADLCLSLRAVPAPDSILEPAIHGYGEKLQTKSASSPMKTDAIAIKAGVSRGFPMGRWFRNLSPNNVSQQVAASWLDKQSASY